MPVWTGSAPDEGATGRAATALKWLGFALLAVVAFECAQLAFWSAFTSFKPWDDEGYFLLALREFRENGGLYERIRGVFYGPFYFQSIAALSWATRMPVDSENARWLMLVGWSVALASAGCATWRLTRSAVAVALALALAFPFLVRFTDEPLHATSVVLLLFAPLVWLVTGPLGDGKSLRSPALVACGALVAALFLVKANLGACFALGTVATFAPGLSGRAGTLARIVTALALCFFPFALMQALLDVDWVLDFALLSATSIAPFALALFRQTNRSSSWRVGAAFGAGFAVLFAVSLVASLLTGSTVGGMWRALVEDALEFPLKNHYEPGLPTRAAILVSAAAIPLAVALRRSPAALAIARLAASAFLLQEGLRMQAPFASLPFVWIAASGGRDSRARHALGAFTVLSALQAYPIAGIQLGLFAVLVMIVGTFGVWDALREIPAFARVTRPVRVTIACAGIAGAALLLTTYNPIWSETQRIRQRWVSGVRLDLPGTGPMRGSELDVARLRWVTENLRENADTFVGVPGVHSFHAWAGIPPPLPFYPHHWVLFHRADEEESLARCLSASPRACAIRNEELLAFWLHAPLPDGPVRRVLDADFACAGVAGDYRFLVRRAVPRRMVLDARPVEGREDLRARFDAGRVFALTLPALGDARVTRLTLVNTKSGLELFDTARPEPLRRLLVTDGEGNRLLGEPGATLPDTDRVSRVLLLWPSVQREPDARVLLVRAYDASGRIAARCVVQGPGFE